MSNRPIRPTQRVFIFGATGSIGYNALSVCRDAGIEVVGVGIKGNIEALKECISGFDVKVIHIADETKAAWAEEAFPSKRLFFGYESICDSIAISGVDTVLNGVSGGAGLRYSIAAVNRSVPKLALANKESLVMAGRLLIERANDFGTAIIPVDSEHSALFRLLNTVGREGVRRLILTASGGPFLEESKAEPSPEDVLAHPLWRMGKRITVDSATMFNKVFEVIEAHHLFGFDYRNIEILIHPEGIIHGLVELSDGSVVAHMSVADMRLPISYALYYPDEPSLPLPLSLSGTAFRLLSADVERFKALKVLNRLREGVSASYAIALNAADEVAVEAFLERRVGFHRMVDTVLSVADAVTEENPERIGDVYRIDSEARVMAEERLGE